MLNSKVAPILRDSVGSVAFLNGKLLPVEVLQGLCQSSISPPSATITPPLSPSTKVQDANHPENHIVYEVVRWRNNKPGWCEHHAERMAASLTKFGYFNTKQQNNEQQQENVMSQESQQWWPPLFRSAITSVAQANQVSEQNVKVVVWQQDEKIDVSPEGEVEAENEKTETKQFKEFAENHFGSPNGVNMVAFLIKSFYPPKEWYSDDSTEEKGENSGVCVAVMNARRDDPHSKVPMPELRARAQKIQQDFGCFEVLLKRPSDGVLTEGSRSNFILIMKKEGQGSDQQEEVELVEALDQDVLMGITRHAIDKICQVQNIPLVKRNITCEDLLSDRTIGMALTGTSLGCLPVKHLITFEDDDEHKKMTKKSIGPIPDLLKELQKQYAMYRDGVKEFPK